MVLYVTQAIEEESMEREPLLLSVMEAARMANIGRSSAYSLCRNGEWPTVRIGRIVRVPVKKLEEWIEAHCEQGQ
jgi:excisionase family DNA binding protein